MKGFYLRLLSCALLVIGVLGLWLLLVMLVQLWGVGLVVAAWFTLPRREKISAIKDLLGILLGFLLLGVASYYLFS